eukprot:364271-Chlamydomonas_euryale.AAC.10
MQPMSWRDARAGPRHAPVRQTCRESKGAATGSRADRGRASGHGHARDGNNPGAARLPARRSGLPAAAGERPSIARQSRRLEGKADASHARLSTATPHPCPPPEIASSDPLELWADCVTAHTTRNAPSARVAPPPRRNVTALRRTALRFAVRTAGRGVLTRLPQPPGAVPLANDGPDGLHAIACHQH